MSDGIDKQVHVQVTEKPYSFLKGGTELRMIGAFKGKTRHHKNKNVKYMDSGEEEYQ